MYLPHLLLILCSLQADPAPLTEERLKAIARDAIVDVERASSRRFVKPPRIKISGHEEVEGLLVEEILPQMKLLLPPDTPSENIPTEARQQARMFATLLVAKYSSRDDCIHVMPETMSRLAELLHAPAFKSEGTLRVVVTHELVHALDGQTMKVFDKIPEAKTRTELEIVNALLEGHAQHLTRRIFAERKEVELFDGYERLILAGPPGQSEAEKALATIATQSLKFAYLDGRAFFDGLAKTGKASYIADAFKNPPKEKNGILHPERFYEPPAAAGPVTDVEPVFEAFAAPYKEAWSRNKSDIDESSLRTVFGDFVDAKAVDEALKTLVSARTIALTPKAAPGSRLAILLVGEHKDAAAAERFRDLSIALSRAKDERMKTGSIRIVKSETETIKTPAGHPLTLITKTLAVPGQEVVVRTACSARGGFNLEIIFSNAESTPEGIAGTVDQLWSVLKKKE
jgi:hypothetical protein